MCQTVLTKYLLSSGIIHGLPLSVKLVLDWPQSCLLCPLQLCQMFQFSQQKFCIPFDSNWNTTSNDFSLQNLVYCLLTSVKPKMSFVTKWSSLFQVLNLFLYFCQSFSKWQVNEVWKSFLFWCPQGRFQKKRLKKKKIFCFSSSTDDQTGIYKSWLCNIFQLFWSKGGSVAQRSAHSLSNSKDHGSKYPISIGGEKSKLK